MMKKSIKLLLATFLATVLCTTVGACGGKPSGGNPDDPGNSDTPPVAVKNTFSWYETQSQTREIGTNFDLSSIWGKYGDEYISPEISVKYNGETPEFDLDNKILPLYELGDYEITLTFTYQDDDGQSVMQTKNFTVTSADRTAPTIARVDADRLFAGDEIELDNLFTAYDAVDKENVEVTYSVTSPTQKAVSLTDGKFTADEFGDYTVAVTAKDSRNNSDTKEFTLYIRNANIFESFRKEDEAGAKGYEVNGRDFEITEAHAEGDGDCLKVSSVAKYDHPYVKFLNSVGVDWANTNGLLFTIYNAKAAKAYVKIGGMVQHTDIWGNNNVVLELEGNSRNTVYVSAEQLAANTSNGEKYLFAEVCYENNGGKSYTTGQIELYFDDVVYATAEEAEAYKIPESLMAAEINGGAVLLNTRIEKDGKMIHALNFKPNGTWMRFYFTHSDTMEWSKIKSYTVSVYNATEATAGFKFGNVSDPTNAGGSYGMQLVTLEKGWNTVSINVSGYADGDYLFVGCGAKDSGFSNSSDNFESYKANGIYFANFEATQYTDEEMELYPKMAVNTNFVSGAVEEKTIGGENKIATTISGITTANRYPYAIFTGYSELEWADGKALSFKVLNNSSEYEFMFGVYMLSDNTQMSDANRKLIGYCMVEPGKTQQFVIYAEDFDFATYKHVAIGTSHYTTSSGQADSIGSTGQVHDEADLLTFDCSFYDFVFEDKEKPTSDDYKQASQFTASGSNGSVNYNKDYVYSGDYSYAFNSYGNWPSFVADFTGEYDWSRVKTVSFRIYNPYTSSYYVGATIDTVKQTNIELKAGEWTLVTLDVSAAEIASGSKLTISSGWSTGVSGSYNCGETANASNTDKWRAFRLYFDDFATEQYTDEEIGLYSKMVVNTNFVSGVVEEKTIGGESKIVSTISGITTANRYPYAIFTGYSELEWADGKALSFKVLNNSSEYEFMFGVYMLSDNTQMSDANRKLIGYCMVEPGKTQQFVIYAEDFDFATYKHVAIGTSHYTTSSGQADSIGSTGQVHDEADLLTFDCSFYDFVFEDKEKPTSDDYKQASQFTASGSNGSVNYNKDYVYSGDYSYAFNSYGNWPSFVADFTGEYDWSRVKTVSFRIYNPYTSSYYVGATIDTVKQTNIELKAGEWTLVTLDVSAAEIASGSKLTISSGWSTGVSGSYNCGETANASNTDKWRAFRLYFDDFAVAYNED